MVSHVFFAWFLLLVAIFNGGAVARRGGGGDHDSDSDGDSSSDGDNNSGSGGSDGSSGSSGCGSGGTSNGLSTTYLVPRHAWNWTSQSGAYATDSPTIYDGSYFQGEGSLSYNMTTGTQCQITKQLRLLGYAWVGPQVPYPTGPENPFIVGFKAWESTKSVSEIHSSYTQITWEGDSCSSQPDLFRIVTTKGSASRTEAADTMIMNVSTSSAAPDVVDFNATTGTDSDLRISDSDGLFRLRAESCASHDTDMHWPATTVMQGSVTNTTLELKFSGSVDQNSSQYQSYDGINENLKVNFTLTFSGQFDSVNSTHALNVQRSNQSLAWVPNSATNIASGAWGYILIAAVGIHVMALDLW
ncbi:hypothetical protein BDV32DRAFT_32643 [Aspergillus pseudonomiae]|uniref:Uncharacterized protein n=1 Tax=Aspergillus pseudonomiae TaxID=1506151 RepID=A0A5N7DLJ8_9EURO|nr:uncharacterized protein BDV37DRAFT_291577 [Aspergillus pseudonomiae]KAB8261631.1 hypothetical protein BDV32DRAFT_32643 [Aspergillus pseudonomiae]KAE8406863.1 hypothetical protein BDV37DRAFT_291577 [Aspergillus pseudonomiae]